LASSKKENKTTETLIQVLTVNKFAPPNRITL